MQKRECSFGCIHWTFAFKFSYTLKGKRREPMFAEMEDLLLLRSKPLLVDNFRGGESEWGNLSEGVELD